MLTLDDIAGLSDVMIAIMVYGLDEFDAANGIVLAEYSDEFQFIFTQLHNAFSEEYIRRKLDHSTWYINAKSKEEQQ